MTDKSESALGLLLRRRWEMVGALTCKEALSLNRLGVFTRPSLPSYGRFAHRLRCASAMRFRASGLTTRLSRETGWVGRRPSVDIHFGGRPRRFP